MKQRVQIPVSVIRDHLKKTGTAIGLHKDGVGCFGYRVLLDDEDIGRLMLWWQHKIHTKGESRRVIDALPSSAENTRIRPFMEGDPSRGLLPVDLRDAKGLEIVAEADNIESERLDVIDGNHRIIAQQLKHGSFEGVPMFVCVRSKLSE